MASLKHYFLYALLLFQTTFAAASEHELETLYQERCSFWMNEKKLYLQRSLCATAAGIGIAVVGGYAAHAYLNREQKTEASPKPAVVGLSQEELNKLLYEQHLEARKPLTIFTQTVTHAATSTLIATLLAAGGAWTSKNVAALHAQANRWFGLNPFEKFKELAAHVGRSVDDHRVHLASFYKKELYADFAQEIVERIIDADRRLIITLLIDMVAFVRITIQHVGIKHIQDYDQHAVFSRQIATKIMSAPYMLSASSVADYLILIDSIAAFVDQLGGQFARDLKISE